MDQIIFNPLEDYEKHLKDAHASNTEQFFEELVTRSGINKEENAAAVVKYNTQQKKADESQRKASFWNTLQMLAIIIAVMAAIAAFAAFANGSFVLSIVAALLSVGLLLIWFFVLKPKIKNLDQIYENERKKAEQLLEVCRKQMAPLNALFDSWDGITLFEKTLPKFDFLPSFSQEQEKDMRENYNFPDYNNEEHSILDTLSGRYNGNPFLFEQRRVHKMGLETYHGYKTISWTSHYTDSKGKHRTRIHSQTLHASVTKPKPFYHTETYLHYGAQAGPDLSFSRLNQHLEDMSQRAIDSLVRKGERKLQNKATEALKNSQNFMGMTNTEFDVLFDALDRDHEVQFRMLFTPLAQTNMVDLLRSETGYGDDFDFFKQKRMNTIVSEHSQNRSLLVQPDDFHSHDYEVIRKKFLDGQAEYFRAVYFDFAPLLALPVYQEQPAHSLAPLPNLSQKYSTWEHEALANALDSWLLVHPNTQTPAILKADYVGREQQAEQVRITAHSYDIIERMDLVPTLDNNGRAHIVEVPWKEYIPLSSSKVMSITTEKPDGANVHTHGLYTRVIN